MQAQHGARRPSPSLRPASPRCMRLARGFSDDIARRCARTQVGIAAVFGKGTALQLFCTGFLSVAWLALQVKEQPYFFLEVRVFASVRPAGDTLLRRTNSE